MPQAVAAAGWALVGAVGGVGAVATAGAFLVNNAVLIGIGGSLLGSAALSSSQKKKAERKAREQYNAAQVDRLVDSRTTTGPWELAMGRMRKAGTLVFEASTGTNKTTFVRVTALAAHEIDGIEQYHLNDEWVVVEANGDVNSQPYAVGNRVSATANTGPGVTSVVLPHAPIEGSVTAYTGTTFGPEGDTAEVAVSVSGNTVTTSESARIEYQYTSYQTSVNLRLINATGVADARLMALFPGMITTAHRFAGHALLVMECTWSETAFPAGIPNASVVMRGAKIHDPRTGLTVWTENPALMMRHVYRHPYFGKSTPTAAEDARLIAAANACDTSQAYGAVTAPLFRAATVIPYGTAPKDAFDDLTQAMAGMWAYGGGELYVRAGVWTSPVLSLGDDDLKVIVRNGASETMHPVEIAPHRERAQKINTANIQIWDMQQGYKQVTLPPLTDAALVARDGAVLAQPLTYAAIGFAPQAWHVAAVMMRDARDPLTVVLPFKMRAYPVELLDVITLTIPRWWPTPKSFMVLGRGWTSEGMISLTIKETSAAIYTPGNPLLPGGYADNTSLPRPWDVPVVGPLAAYSGQDLLLLQGDGTIVSRMRVTWPALTDSAVVSGGRVEVQYRLVGGAEWTSISVDGDQTQAVIPGVQDAAFYLVRARARTSLAVGLWSPQITHKIVGKTEPPPNIVGLSINGAVLSWSLPVRVLDLAGFVFRFHYGVNLDWNSAAPLHDGVVTENPWEPKRRPGGVVTVMGKAIDTTKNESLATANIVMNLGDAPIANVIEQWDFKGMGWPFAAGEQSGWTLIGGDPTADALDSFYGTDDQSFYGPDTESFYEASAYGQMVYVTPEVSINSALAGSVMTLQTLAEGIDLRIFYRLSGPGSFYGPDGASFYGEDAEPFYGAPGGWMPWPGQLIAANDVYQFRVIIGAGVDRGILLGLTLTVDAPDLEEVLADVAISAGGTAIPFSKPFTSIKAITATLQANGSGAVTVETDKTSPLAPVIRAYNAAHTAVSGATADIVLKGY